MAAIAYIRGFVDLFLIYQDVGIAHRNGVLHVSIARKNKARRLALRGRA